MNYLTDIKKLRPKLDIIIFTQNTSDDNLFKALCGGAIGFVLVLPLLSKQDMSHKFTCYSWEPTRTRRIMPLLMILLMMDGACDETAKKRGLGFEEKTFFPSWRHASRHIEEQSLRDILRD